VVIVDVIDTTKRRSAKEDLWEMWSLVLRLDEIEIEKGSVKRKDT
jgi:hypothetical protein